MARTVTRQKAPPVAAAAPRTAPRAGARTTARAPRAGPRLLVVESPAKGKTLQRLLGTGWEVRASAGHVKDLPSAKEGVDVEHGFLPTYEVLKGKNRVLSELRRASLKAPQVLLATDPDREGEAIAWHLAEELGAPGGDARIGRVLLQELTAGAVQRAVAQPEPLDRRRFEAQQARRILDRLVGFRVSPILWKKVRRGLSAGRVQSVAVRLLVDREREIEAFRPAESWSLEAGLRAGRPPAFRAQVTGPGGEEPPLPDRAAVEALLARLEGAGFRVERVERRELLRRPPAPFTTATLQQEASRRLGFTPRRTMALAQRLYEGVELGDEGAVGLLTYVRSDSVRLSPEAVEAARRHVEATWGADHLPAEPPIHRARSRSAQEAHEAIRPTSLDWPPERVGELLEEKGARDLCRLYALVWSRFLASQMAPAAWEETRVAIAAGTAPPVRLLAKGLRRVFLGYLAAHGERPPSDEAGAEEPGPLPVEAPLPPLAAGDELRLEALHPERHLSAPPPRFDEAGLVRELEVRGIGRPSTYASILDLVQEKGYVERVERALRPTGLGRLVTEELVRCFPRELDPAFTARMEARLDEVEEGTAGWQEVLQEFWGGFREELARAEGGMREVRGAAPAGIACPRCGKAMVVKLGRNGEFLACPGYPECRQTMDFRREGDRIVPVADEPAPSDEKCPTCGAPMVVKRGRFGRFLACTRYPQCRTSRPLPIGVDCPLGCGGQLTERRSQRGRSFYGCSRYPACDFVSWDRPLAEPCPRCGSAYLVERHGRDGRLVACPHKECGYRRAGDAPPAGPA
ncbi:MAG: type I DNA topoisomerase [Deltaproteobacteria bacterium]|nr:type I DNA topoisomerase [Deltaproteobacteria bacterium]